MDGIEQLFLALLRLDPDATIGRWDADVQMWTVNLQKGYKRVVYGHTMGGALTCAIVQAEVSVPPIRSSVREEGGRGKGKSHT